MIRIKGVPQFKKTTARLEQHAGFDPKKLLEEAGEAGVMALSQGTPRDSGITAHSWGYKITGDKEHYKLIWTNSSVAGRGAPIVLLLQYGHATKSGYFLSGRDFINPALDPVYDSLEKKLRKEVLKK